MKKIVALALTMAVICGSFITAEAKKVGDVVNHYLYTDIIASIDGCDIRSYNIDGYTMVVAEDLRDYGFSVVWDARTKKLIVEPILGSTANYYYSQPPVSSSMIGHIAGDVLYTDISTYFAGEYIDSYNIGGYTCISVDDIAERLDCSYYYDNNARRLYLKRTTASFSDYLGEWRGIHAGSRAAQSSDVTVNILNVDEWNKTITLKVKYSFDAFGFSPAEYHDYGDPITVSYHARTIRIKDLDLYPSAWEDYTSKNVLAYETDDIPTFTTYSISSSYDHPIRLLATAEILLYSSGSGKETFYIRRSDPGYTTDNCYR